MKSSIKELRQLIREEVEYSRALNELFGKPDFGKMMDDIMQDLYDTTKKIEKAHQLAPAGAGKAIVAGLHSDLFNKVAEFREYVNKLKVMAQKKPEQKGGEKKSEQKSESRLYEKNLRTSSPAKIPVRSRRRG